MDDLTLEQGSVHQQQHEHQNERGEAGMTRRGLLGYLAATTGGLCCASGAAALGGDPHAHGQMSTVSSCQLSLAPNQPASTVRIIASLGNPALDQLVLKERAPLNSAFGVQPDLYVFDDGGVPNAFAVPRSRSGRGTGTILLGQALVVQELEKTGFTTGSLKGIMAHEWTHIVQFRSGNTMSTKHRELHADFMAGWYLRRVGNLGETADFQTFANTLYSKGDFGFYNHVHHGTPSERVNAMLLGSQRGESNFWDVYRYGERLVTGRFV